LHRGIFIFLALIAFTTARAAEVRGIVTDENNVGLPFTTLYLKGTSTGTTTNLEGFYAMQLQPGPYQLVFQYVGYKTQVHDITITSSDLELNVRMVPDVIRLNEVVIKAGQEDPAYRVIRNAIKKRKFHLTEINGYSCDVYVKGLQRLDKVPEKILGFNLDLDTGIVYLSESVSQLSFKQPDDIKETVISSKVSGNNQAFSYNMAHQMMANFYQNLLEVQGLTERGFVSPIANNALLFYNYRLDGIIKEGDIIINKIEVIPKRKSDPSFVGYIYIIEDSWRIHSLNLMLTKNQIEFVDSLKINQIYAPLDHDHWMLFTQRFSFKFKAFGIEGNGYFVGVNSNYEIEPTFSRKFFSHEIYSVQMDANQKDSIYWATIRPIPLTQTELTDYHLKDSIQVIKETKVYKDSVDSASNRITISNILLGGYVHADSYRSRFYRFDPIISAIQFNTVEGLVLNFRLGYTKRYEDKRFFRITPELRYGFSGKDFYGQVKGRYGYNPKKYAYIEAAAGHFVAQYNHQNPISPFINTVMTLFVKENYMKLYEKTYGRITYRNEMVNGLRLTGSIEFSERRQLENTTDFTFFNWENKEYTSNIPVNANLSETSFITHQALLLDLQLQIRFAQKYWSRPYEKINLGSKYPALDLVYRTGIKALGGDVKYDQVEIRLHDNLRYGLVGSGEVFARAGTFINNDNLTFIDFKHFNGNRTPFAKFDLRNFQLLDYYFYSTDGDYYTAYYEHHFNGFIFNKIPLIRKTKIQAVAGVNFLYTDASRSYFEFGLGVEHIFKIARVDVFTNLLDGKRQSTGVRLGIGF